MEDRKRTILAVVIACVVLIAVLYSFGLNLFIQHQIQFKRMLFINTQIG